MSPRPPRTRSGGDEWTVALDGFRAHLLDAGLAPATVATYLARVGSLATYGRSQGREPADLRAEDVRGWLERIGTTRPGAWRSAARFFDHAVTTGLAPRSPVPEAPRERPGPSPHAAPEDAAWAEVLADYEAWMRAGGRAPTTVRLHQHYLRQVARAVPAAPEAVTEDDLLRILGRTEWSQETRKSARSVFTTFYGWARRRGLVDVDPALNLPPIRVPLGTPRPTPEHVVGEALARASARGDERLVLMLELGALCGLRAAEIARVHGNDLINDTLLILGKGSRRRTVPVADDALLARLEGLGDRWAFPSPSGGHLTPGHVTKLIGQGLPDGWTAHTLRHRMASVAHAGTSDLYAVKRLLGHSQLSTTERYVLLPDDHIRRAARAAARPSARANLSIVSG